MGVPKKAIRTDDANDRIPVPTESGNVIVDLPGDPSKGSRVMFSAHMDTVPLTAGVKPVRKGKKIVPETGTALGGDDRTGVAVLLTLAAELAAKKVSHRPITLLFTVREESGLFGARHLNPVDVKGPEVCYNFDGKYASEVCIGAIGAQRWEAEIKGKASHAGVHPEAGISATMVAALALAEVHQGGWFGKVVKPEGVGTSNVGSLGDAEGKSAGNATNTVTAYCYLTGECRSHDPKFAKAITDAYKAAFKSAAEKVTDAQGKPAKVKFTARVDYEAFKLDEGIPAVASAKAAIQAIGREATLRVADGGLDANWLNKHGIPTVTFGAGQNEIHTVKEFVNLSEFVDGCRVALALATAG